MLSPSRDDSSLLSSNGGAASDSSPHAQADAGVAQLDHVALDHHQSGQFGTSSSDHGGDDGLARSRSRSKSWVREGGLKDWCTNPAEAHSRRKCQFGVCAAMVLLLVILLIVYARNHSSHDDPAPYGIRLPQAVQPTHYYMDLNASVSTERFSGRMVMDLFFASETAEILFHAVDLDISEVQFTDAANRTVAPAAAAYVGQHDLYRVALPFRVAAGANAKLSMQFAGIISHGLGGFYISDYKTSSGATKIIASTQFESTDARLAFPCFDEPAFKANFSITITTEAYHKTILSNMPNTTAPVLVGADNAWQRVSFDATPRMSTYLVAYVICDFAYVEALTARGVPVRVWTDPEKISYTAAALKAGVDSLNRYEDFFKLAYPLPKSDQVAIPNFAAGAMENWGLVTYRETALLVSDDSREANSEQSVVMTVAHELAHQWFGDIVTMAWWDGLWLNEGFASFVEYIGMAAYNGNWDAAAQLVVFTQGTAMALDSSQYSHAIVQTVNDPREIEALFDSISYDKGSSILLMLSDVLGYSESDPNSPFQLGLQVYLSQHAYGNAATADLWSALQSHAPASLEVTVAELMSSYTDQMGYPLLTLKADAAQPGFLVGTQRRFLELPYAEQDPSLRDGQAKNKWDVLVRFQEKGQPADARWMRKADNSVKIPYNGTYIVANKGRAGFYRVNYPAPVWQQIGDALLAKDAFFGNADMCGLLDDVWTLALSGETPYTSAFHLTSFLGNQDFGIYTAWAAAFTNLGRAKALVSSFPETSQRFNRYVVEKLIGTNALSLTPWNPLTDHLQALLQQQFIGSLIAYNSTSARAEAARLWAGLVVNGTDVPVDIRDAVYRVGIEDGDDAEWQFLYQRYHSTLDAAEARRTLRALARSLNVTQLSVLLDMSSIPSEVKQQDQTRTIIYVSSNPVGQAVAWEWVKTNWNLLYKRFGSQSFALGELVSRVVGQLQTQAALNEARAFFADKPLGSAALALKQAFEAVTVNIFWLRERYAEFDAALKDVVPA